ncbi:sensor histidine kinase [Pontibacter roseus]|uniref:sensor histidine kinase n=1 Tax=Pontibacter roseus TaxID=336989 RepID=UPI0003639482|nr:HAMP domain-containing sensor histidine kinase [Pontibacter roseus]
MSKSTIIGVIVLMSISLLGVVGLQLYWISDAIRVKQEQFDRSVHEALTRVVEKLETREAVSAVANGMATLQHAPQVPAAIPATPPLPEQTAPEEKAAKSGPRENKKRHQEAARSEAATQEENPLQSGTVWTYAEQPNTQQGKGNNYLQFSYAIPDSAYLERYLQQVPQGIRLSQKQLEQVVAVRSLVGDSIRLAKARGNGSIHFDHLTEGTITYRRQLNNTPIRISVDTLQYIALHLDSLLRQRVPHVRLKQEEIAAINVIRDSVFVVQRAATRLQEQQLASLSAIPGRVLYRPVTPLQEAQALQEKPARGRAAAKETPKPTPPTPEPPAIPDPLKVEAKKEKLNNVVEKMVVEYVSKDVPLQERLNLANLQPMLKSELNNKGICLDFGYWVLSGQQDTVAAAHIAAAKSDDFATYKANLFPNDIWDKPDYLAVYFPDSQTYALQSLWVMLLFSAVFTLVIVATFGTTIHIIFKQKKLSEMKNDFINNMTHEFKTPIATISLATDSIANPRVYSNPDKIQYYTNIIRQENKRMNVQVENVLQIAQLEKNEFKMNLQPVDLHALVVKAVESIRLQVEERLGQVTAQLNALEHELKLDEVHAYNVICNLLDNANKYSPNSPDIRLVTQNVEGGILLAVEDKGMGMTRDTQMRVFEKFYRVPTGNLHNVKGFGLGLSYVKAIVKAHHGQVRLQSELGRGSRFEVFLPFNT